MWVNGVCRTEVLIAIGTLYLNENDEIMCTHFLADARRNTGTTWYVQTFSGPSVLFLRSIRQLISSSDTT